ncbi:hypothetical protein J1605_013444 [Eschrichtius robustus]|uniref:Uncharacterized protein n=1 Tax=Eschrichtius robustus TaxID=9764 RepID=A0AB34GHK3_ESCRO|nr:hypothetical protein J1605_013444 [Eschrichtius robustus]
MAVFSPGPHVVVPLCVSVSSSLMLDQDPRSRVCISTELVSPRLSWESAGLNVYSRGPAHECCSQPGARRERLDPNPSGVRRHLCRHAACEPPVSGGLSVWPGFSRSVFVPGAAAQSTRFEDGRKEPMALAGGPDSFLHHPYYQPPQEKAAVLAFLVHECSGSALGIGEIDKSLESMSRYRRNKWIVEGRLRRLKTALAKRTGRPEVELRGQRKAWGGGVAFRGSWRRPVAWKRRKRRRLQLPSVAIGVEEMERLISQLLASQS